MIRIQTEDFDLAQEEARLRAGNTQIGAIATFTGLVRDIHQEVDVEQLRLEHYPGMTEKALAAIDTEARERWPLIDTTIIHRVGNLRPGDRIVLVAVASMHRKAAFSACEFIMDYLKTRAPFWKKESNANTTRWVEERKEDQDAAGRWRR